MENGKRMFRIGASWNFILQFVRSIMDQMNAHVYELHGQIYRRNVPLERISQVNYALDAKLADVENDEEFAPACEPPTATNIVVEEIEEKEECVDISLASASIATLSKFVKFDDKKKVYYSNLEIPSNLVGLVAGAKYKKIYAIEESSNAKIKVPKKSGKVSDFFEIYADAVHKVERARDLLELDILKARQKAQPTHFVSFPLSRHQALCEAYTALVKKIRECEEIPEECRSEELFRPVEKIHLTVSVLRLFSEEDERLAKTCINEFISRDLPKFLKDGADVIPIKFAGLGFFGASKKKARVVYAKAESEVLQRVADALDEKLVTTGLAAKRTTPSVVLHMTILNAKHGKVKEVDATELLARFGKADLPSIDISEVRICMMNEVDPYTNGHPVLFSSSFV